MELSEKIIDSLSKIARSIRGLTIDCVENAGSGHPGLPMGCAEIGAYLYGFYMQHDPSDPKWVGRDRFILSAGHGVLLQYICLHLSGYNISIEDLKEYRRGGSKTPSHPQCFVTEGIETTTGADGHGVANGVGLALGLKIIKNEVFKNNQSLAGQKVLILAGDGCMMEGISSEACSLAGHLNLNNLILIYDQNQTTLDGYANEISSENVEMRFKSYGWDVAKIDGHNFHEIHEAFKNTKLEQQKPILIIANTIIGRGSTKNEGTPSAHGKPFGKAEAIKAKKNLQLSENAFFINKEVYNFFKNKRKLQKIEREKWNCLISNWKQRNPETQEILKGMNNIPSIKELELFLKDLKIESPIPTRFASNQIINYLTKRLPQLYGGSADSSVSDGTFLYNYQNISANNSYRGRNIKYGVREFAMAAMSIGLAQTDLIIPFIGGFLAFSDYMRPSIRFAALMKTKVIYHFSHDSIFVCEDGPTHQPIEHLASLRAIPNLQVIRPADANETKNAWIAALNWKGPTALILCRQPVNRLTGTSIPYSESVGKGAYIVKQAQKPEYDYLFLATGSEVDLAIQVAEFLEKEKKDSRVVSMPSWEIFEKQSNSYKNYLLKGSKGRIVSIEAGIKQGWEKYIGKKGISISIECFGCSGEMEYIKRKFGFNVEDIVKKIKKTYK